MSNLEKVLQETSDLVYEKMDNLLPDLNTCSEKRIIEAMRYSALAPGKRLRPFLTVTTANLFGVGKQSALQAAAAIEFLHTYSLIHDDLPAMDNDSQRRGQPSSHIKFDEATAILAGDALLTMAFEILSDKSTHSSATVRCNLINALAKASGAKGMVGGQMLDMLSEKKEQSINEIIRQQRLKTGELFAVSCEAGAILGNAASSLRNVIKGYAHDIGLAFQITDDLLDEKENSKKVKSSDKKPKKSTFITALGPAKAKEQARILVDQAIRHLKIFDKKADLLKDLARYIIERKK